ncbi:MAG: PAS domain S-box protein, partial [candidate division Zixibacteria bacterium]|nr:PAS domain S-box protein [candidate division Zixibacteria bacterium]
MLAQSGATNLTHFIDTLRVAGEPLPAFVFRSAEGLLVYSDSFKRLLQFDESIYSIYPVRYDEHGNVVQIVASRLNATWILQVEQRRVIELVRTFFWVYQEYFLLALIALLVVLVAMNTKRRKALLGLAENQTKFQQLFRSIPEAVALLDPNGQIVDINPVFEYLFGYRLEEIQGKDISELLVPDHLRLEGRMIDSNSERHVSFDTLRRHKDGTLINISHSGSTVMVGNKMVGRLALYKDMTERIRAEDVLRMSEEKFRLLVESVRSAIAVIDYNGVFLFANELAARVHAMTPDELIGESMWNLFPKELADYQVHRVRQVIETRKEFAEESQVPQLGEPHWYGNILQPYVDAQGEVVAALLIATDITEHKAAEMALRESDDRLRQVVDDMPVMMLAFDDAGCFVTWNRECERVTGYTAEEMLNNPRAIEILCPDDAVRASIRAEWRERGNDYRDLEWEITCHDGTRRITSWSNISDRLPIPGWTAWSVGIDVTERNKARQQLEQSKEKYQHLFENAQVGMFRIQMEPEGLREVNEKLCSMLGYTREELLTKVYSDILVDHEHFESARSELLQSGKLTDVELVVWNVHGEKRIFSVSASLYQHLGYFEGSVLDITDSKRAMEAVRESEEKYRSLQENLPVGIYRASVMG